MPRGIAANAKATLPRPRFRVVRDTPQGANSIKFFQYWADIPADKLDLVEVRAYRLWPIVDLKITDPNRKTVEWEIFRGKIPFQPDEYIQEALHRWGSGEWKCILNEIGVAGEIMECYFSAVDMETFPPKLDLQSLVQGNYKNDNYIDWLRRRGETLPWDEPVEEDSNTEKENDNMLATELMKSALEQNAKLTDKLIESSQTVADAKIEANAQQPPDLQTLAQQRSIEVIASAADRTVEMVTKHAGSSYDAVELLKVSSELMGRRETGSDERWMQMILERDREHARQLAEMQTRQFDALQRQNEALQAQLVQSRANPETPAKQDDLLDQVRKVEELKALLGVAKRAVIPEESRSSWIKDLLENPAALSAIGNVAGAVLTPFANLMTRFLAPSQPVPQAQNGTGHQQGVPFHMQVQQQSAQPQPVQQAQPVQPQQTEHPIMGFIRWIEPAFIDVFYAAPDDISFNGTGYGLAEWVCCQGSPSKKETPEGRRVYMNVKEQMGFRDALDGQKVIILDAFIQQHESLWSKVKGLPKRYSDFLIEFFTYDEMLSAKDQDSKGEAA